ncbi:DNA mismatch repair protein MutT [Peribacillus deserti]|uniref:DNA mismatch repair protein MutT n=2 Tax=Peribacillus deserti TaxID=673318 RepID=A0A2N5M4W1_9BACI|nr:DNA mismatch repair protein MutT [Peribacillus deserti]
MLFRSKAPNQYKWNGVGGKIEPHESPYSSIEREIYEETGLRPVNLRFGGIVTWNHTGGMYLFTADDPGGSLVESEEGSLEWKPINLLKHSDDVVPNITFFIDRLLAGHPPCEYSCTYDKEGKLLEVQERALPNPVITSVFQLPYTQT